MSKHFVFIGAGAVGAYIGGSLAERGHKATLVDSWPEHINKIKSDGLTLNDSNGNRLVKVHALHIGEVQSLVRDPADVVAICTKSFDTKWATELARDYLAVGGYVVSMQNGINEERIAEIVGWGRTMGCILSGIGVNCVEPGLVHRFLNPGSESHAVFRIGEVHGRQKPRSLELAETLGCIDKAMVTSDLWGERWTKLITNSFTHGVLGATGLWDKDVYLDAANGQVILAKVLSESIKVGRALGFQIGTLCGNSADTWCATADGNPDAIKEMRAKLLIWCENRLKEASRSSVGRDISRGRRPEIDFTTGLIAAKADEVGVAAPLHKGLLAIIKRIERGEIEAHPTNIVSLFPMLELQSAWQT